MPSEVSARCRLRSDVPNAGAIMAMSGQPLAKVRFNTAVTRSLMVLPLCSSSKADNREQVSGRLVCHPGVGARRDLPFR